MRTSVFVALNCALLTSCATHQRQTGGSYVLRGKFHSVTLQPPARWQPTWQHQFPSYQTVRFSLIGVVGGPEFTVRIDPARAVDSQGQRTIHDQILAGYRETFVTPVSRTVATVSANGRDTLIQLYTGIDTHQYSAVVPLGRETVSFWLGDSHGEPISPYQDDFISTIRSATFQ